MNVPEADDEAGWLIFMHRYYSPFHAPTMITGTAQVVQHEEVIIELTVRATVREWRFIMRDLHGNLPAIEFGSVVAGAIDATVGHVEHVREIKS